MEDLWTFPLYILLPFSFWVSSRNSWLGFRSAACSFSELGSQDPGEFGNCLGVVEFGIVGKLRGSSAQEVPDLLRFHALLNLALQLAVTHLDQHKVSHPGY